MTTAIDKAATYENILVERGDCFGTITINRPRSLNSLNHQTLQEISRAMTDLASERSVRAIIITGSGDRAFAAGADISELQALSSGEDGYKHSRDAHEIVFQMQALSKPVIMAINGYALGGGAELAMGGDIILASDNAKFGQPEVNLGIIPGFGGTQRLPRLIGRTRALEQIFTGDHISAEEAYRIGLVNHVVPQDQLMSEAEALARTIAKKGPAAIALAKRAVYEGLELSPREGNELEQRLFGEAVATEDRKEGTSAFLEKRAPRWQGK
jgi:enoyl-CoA hydratase